MMTKTIRNDVITSVWKLCGQTGRFVHYNEVLQYYYDQFDPEKLASAETITRDLRKLRENGVLATDGEGGYAPVGMIR